ncbi:MAG: polysaccharide biosynthesis C-terminal domain-containing protein [Myxococcota bacterium]
MLGFDGFAAHLSLAGHYFEFTIVQIGMICGVTYRYAEAALHASFEQRGVLMLDLVYNTMLVGGTIVGIALETELAFFCGVFSTAAGLRLSTAIALCVRLVGPPRIFVWMGRHRESREDRRYRRMAYLTELGTAFLGTGFDNYLLAAVSTAPEIALYAVAAKIAKQLEVLLPQRMFRRLSQTAFFTRFDQSGDEDEANAMFRFLFTTNAIVGALFAALFVAHGAWALALVFPDEYAEAFWATLLFLSFLTLSTMPMGVVAQAARRPEILVYSRVTVLLNLALGIPMASQFGATGMAGATAFSVAAKSLLEYIMLRRHLPVRLPWVAVSRCLGAAGLSAGAMIASRDWLHPVVSGAGGALIYLAAIRALGVLDDRERRIVANLAPARLAAPVQRILGVTDV